MNAAMKVIEKLEPPLQKDNPNPNLTQWLNYTRLSRNAIDSILSLSSQSEMVLKARYQQTNKVCKECILDMSAAHNIDTTGKGYVQLNYLLSM